MPLNVPGLLVPFHILVNPRIIVPALAVKDIRHLDFRALRKAGYRGAVFDKDNCLTVPYKDTLVPEIEVAWKECREVFGRDNVLIVSNSAGTQHDAGGLQVESVQHHLGVPVLFHSSMKPAYSCIKSIRTYFRSLQHPIGDHELIIVGDRLFTDVVMANRMRGKTWWELIRGVFKTGISPTSNAEPANGVLQTRNQPEGSLAVWTTGVWKREAMFLRFCEKILLDAVQRWTRPKAGGEDNSVFTRKVPEPAPPNRSSILRAVLGLIRSLQIKRS